MVKVFLVVEQGYYDDVKFYYVYSNKEKAEKKMQEVDGWIHELEMEE